MPTATKFDPAVQEQLSVGETTLAEFMEGLSKTISRYNALLAKALPQNPKAHFYYFNENEGGEAGAKKEENKKEEGDAAAESAEKKPKLDPIAATSTEGSATSTEPKRPSSPLLRRSQLPKEEMAKIKDDAKKELLKRQSSVGDFPIVGDEEEKPVKAHTNKHADKKKAAHHGHSHHGIKVKDAAEKKEKGEAEEKTEDEEDKKIATKKGGKKGKSILPKLFEKEKKKEKKDEDAKEEGEVKVLSAAEAAADAEDWEDETDSDDEAGDEGEMTVEQLFAKIAPSPQLLQEIRVLKTEARELSLKFEIIHDWIAMNLPALATEDDEGTTVMGAVIESLMGFMQTVDDIYTMEATYLEERAQLELSFLQNPEIATGLALIAIHDNDTWDSIEVGYRALIRCYLIAHSQLSKNMEQLRAPVKRRINLSM